MLAPLIEALVGARHDLGFRLWADKAYSHPSTRTFLRGKKIKHTIPERSDQIARRKAKGSKGGRPRDQGARAVEGYPIARTDVLTEELQVGTVSMFEQAGYRQVSAPTRRRLVMRRDVGTARHWVIVASRDHARRGVDGGFIMANHGKRAPLARMSRGDGILSYSPTTTYPEGEPVRAVTFVGEVTGDEPEPSDVIAGGFRRAATLREIEPLPLAQIREHLPASRLRFGFVELDAVDADAILALVSD